MASGIFTAGKESGIYPTVDRQTAAVNRASDICSCNVYLLRTSTAVAV